MDKLIRILFSAGVLVLASMSTATAQVESTAGAKLRLLGPIGLVRSGEFFTVEVQLNSADQIINAAEIKLRYPTDRLELIYAGREQSIFTLWPEPPKGGEGIVTMTGGRPGGLYALNATVATIYFRALLSGPATITVDSSATAAYVHDGRGTKLELLAEALQLEIASDLVPGIRLTSITHPTQEFWSHGTTVHVGWVVDPESEYSYAFGTDPVGLPDDTPEAVVGSIDYSELDDGIYYFTLKQRSADGPWSGITQRRFLIDATPPEISALTVVPGRWLGGPAQFTWFASDQTSGIALESAQIGPRQLASVRSPLTIGNDWYGKRITIRVTDAAGNTSEANLILPAGSRTWWPMWGWISLAAIAITLVFLARRRRQRSSR